MSGEFGHREREDEEEGGWSLSDLVGMLRRRWPLIVAMTIAVGALTAAIVMLMPSRYEAVATVQIDPRKRTIVNLENVVAALKTDTATVERERRIFGC